MPAVPVTCDVVTSHARGLWLRSEGGGVGTAKKSLKFCNSVGSTMDLTIYVQSNGMSAAFALSLDVLPHQLTAIAHVTSILQMCSMYAESRPSQKEAHQQLKSYMDKVNLIQTHLVNKQKRRTSAKRGVKPMPVILDSKGDFEESGLGASGSLSDEESTVRPIAPHRQKARTAPAAESDPADDEELRPIPRNDLPDSSPRGSGASASFEDLSPSTYGSARQITDDVNREPEQDAKSDVNDNAATLDLCPDPSISVKSGRSFLPSSLGWKMPPAPISWVWTKKSRRIVPQPTAILPTKTLE